MKANQTLGAAKAEHAALVAVAEWSQDLKHQCDNALAGKLSAEECLGYMKTVASLNCTKERFANLDAVRKP